MGRSELQPGTILHFPGGRSYEILEVIGGGGSALLYEAKALNSEQRLAIKELYPIDGYVRRDGAIVPAGGNGGELAEWKKTLEQREIRLSQRAGRRNHQVVFGLPPVWHRVDLELPDGRRFDGVENTYVRMESLREKGVLLNDYLRTARERGGLALDSALDIMETVLDAYAALHADGFIHGDCQMGNIFLLRAGRRPGIAVIIDFDAARELERDGLSAAVTGDVFATDGYCAPELLLREEGLRLSPACDVWALGFLLLELLTDRGMEEQRDLTAYLVCHPGECRLSRRETWKLGCTAAQSGLLNDILARAMALAPEERFADAGEMREALVALRRCRAMDLSGGLDRGLLWEGACRIMKTHRLENWANGLEGPIYTLYAGQPGERLVDVDLALELALKENAGVYFSGSGGSGKTCAAAQVMQAALWRGERIPIYLDLAKVGTVIARMGLSGVSIALAEELFGETRFCSELERFLRETDCPLLLVADHFHSLSREECSKVLGVFRGIRQVWKDVKLLVIGRCAENPGMDVSVALEEKDLTEGPWFVGEEREELLAHYFLCREYSAGDREIHVLLREQLPALAAWLVQRGRRELTPEELTLWLRQRSDPIRWKEDAPQQFLYNAAQRLGVVEKHGEALCFTEPALSFFAALELAMALRRALAEDCLLPLWAWACCWPESLAPLWPVLCVGETDENGYQRYCPLSYLFERLYALLQEKGMQQRCAAASLARSAAQFCSARVELRRFVGRWEALEEIFAAEC